MSEREPAVICPACGSILAVAPGDIRASCGDCAQRRREADSRRRREQLAVNRGLARCDNG